MFYFLKLEYIINFIDEYLRDEFIMMLRIKFVYKYFDGKFVSREYIDGDLRSKKLKKDIR